MDAALAQFWVDIIVKKAQNLHQYNTVRFLIITLALLFATGLCSAQGTWTLVVDGRVMEGSRKVDKAIITLTKNGVFDKKTRSAANGKFSLVLQPDNDYIIDISKNGYVAKLISVSTKGVPEDKVGKGFPAFPIEIGIFKEMQELDTEILKEPIGKIMYYEKDDDFNYDKSYVKQVKSKLDKLTKEAEALTIKKEAEAATKAKAEAAAAATAKAEAEATAKAKLEAAAAATAKAEAEAAAKAKIEAEAAVKAKAEAEAATKAKAETEAAAKAKAAAEAEAATKAKAEAEAAAKAKAAVEAEAAAKAKIEAEAAAKAKAEAEAAAKAEAEAEAAAKAEAEAAANAKAEAEAKKNAVLEKSYEAAISEGDIALGKKDYDYATNMYKKALGLKPSESYPKDKIVEIEKAIQKSARAKAIAEAKQREVQQRYDALIGDADKAMASEDYAKAISEYSEAANLLPDEEYPKKQTAIAKNNLKGMEAAKLAAAAEAKRKAEEAAKAKEAAEAKASAEAEARRLAEEVAAAKAANQKKNDDAYNAAVASGDKYLKAKKYNEAIAAYQEATSVKPAESYPQTQIEKIDALINADKAALLDAENRKATIEKKYQSAVANGDMSMKFNKYGEAKAFYKEAAGIKPTEAYPKDKLKEIETIEKAASDAEIAALGAQYDAAIATADLSLQDGNYGEAKKKYEEAAVLQPDKTYPKEKLAEIETLIAEEARSKAKAASIARQQDEEYRTVITKADDAMATKNLDAARRGYEEALAIKPDEEYPRKRIAAIDKQVEDARLAKAAAAKAKLDAEAKARADAEANRKTEEAAAAEAKRKAEEAVAEEAKRKAEDAAAAEAKRKAEEAAAAEAKRKAEDAAAAEAKRKAEEAAAAEAKRKADEEAARLKAEADAKARAEAARKAEALRKLREQEEKDRLAALEKEKETSSELDDSEKARHIRQMHEEAHKGMTDEERQRYLAEVALEYPSGLTEERYVDAKKQVTIRILVEDGHASMFKKVVQPWGQTFYFKNGMNTTKYLWESESDPD